MTKTQINGVYVLVVLPLATLLLVLMLRGIYDQHIRMDWMDTLSPEPRRAK